ncbi:unnamed protein product [Spodoptera exigua]|nr:unnamed protein product [Spodoptera exigua]
MQKKIMCLVLTLTVARFAESWPRKPEVLENLNADYSAQGFDDEDEATNPFSKLLRIGEVIKKPIVFEEDGKDVNLKIIGSKKKNSERKNEKTKYRSGDTKSFYKTGGSREHGAYDDLDINALANAIAATAAVIKANENRTYRRGNKTRGFHRVHHKDEYKKDQEFYEDDETKGSINKNALNGAGKSLEVKGTLNKGTFNHDQNKGLYGKEGFLENGFTDTQFVGFDDSLGLDASFSNEIS